MASNFQPNDEGCFSCQQEQQFSDTAAPAAERQESMMGDDGGVAVDVSQLFAIAGWLLLWKGLLTADYVGT